jgi:8-oxo-dGTP pyrophosphatase MutT (NUDIX family)
MMLEKVTIFLTRGNGAARQLLLLHHPYAGIQLPAGTVEPGEAPQAAAVRETAEETGLTAVTVAAYLGAEEWVVPGRAPLVTPATVYARPNVSSFGWATLPRGSGVQLLRRQPPFAHVTYEEWDDLLHPHYLTYQITGWVEERCLGRGELRHFFHLETAAATPPQWRVETDNHLFTLFWAPLDALPPLLPFIAEWLRHLPR